MTNEITRTRDYDQTEAQWAFTRFAQKAVAKAAFGREYIRNPKEWREGMIVQVERALRKAKPDGVFKCQIETPASGLERVCVYVRGYEAYFKTFDFEK